MAQKTVVMDHDTLKQEISHADTTTNYQVDHHDTGPLEEEPQLHLKTFLVLLVSPSSLVGTSPTDTDDNT